MLLPETVLTVQRVQEELLPQRSNAVDKRDQPAIKLVFVTEDGRKSIVLVPEPLALAFFCLLLPETLRGAAKMTRNDPDEHHAVTLVNL